MPAPTGGRPDGSRVRTGALTGFTAVSAAVVAWWLFARAFERAPFPPFSYGDWFIRRAPGPMATEAIERLGPGARDTVVVTTVAVMLAAGAATATAHRWLVPVIVLVVALAGAWLAPGDASPALAAGGAMVGALAASAVVLVHRTPGTASASNRRRTLLLGGLATGLVALASLALVANVRRGPPRGIISARPLSASPSLQFLGIQGLSPLITAPEDHYLVDINLQRPRIERGAWELRVQGLVESPAAFTLPDLLKFDLVERAVVLQCISNWPAGNLVGNAAWTCFPFSELVDRVRPNPEATMVLVRAYDGYFESFPLDEAGDWLVAVGMGGSELPADHGFPARLLYPGHYGMRSVKWVSTLEFVAADPGSYWHDRGWDREAVMRIGSRFDVPRSGNDLRSPVVFAGVAYGPAPVTAVDISFDDGGTWAAAELEPQIDTLAWTRWKANPPLPPGRHEVRVRARVGEAAQDATRREPHPSGASGLDLRLVEVVAGGPGP